MKCETWFCKPYLIRRNLTRFWPAWAGFGLFLLIWELSCWDAERLTVSGLLQPALIFVPLCGLVAAMLVFGYLFVPRHVNTMHSLPVGREGLFLTNVLSGLSLMALPLILTGLVALLRLHDWFSVLVWMGKVAMCYFYGFSLGTMASVLAGTRLGAITMWCLLAFGHVVLEGLLKIAASAVLWGVEINSLALEFLCPMIYGAGNVTYMLWVDAVCLGLLILVLFLYRLRKTEATGDFIAFTWLTPVIKILLTLMGGILLGNMLASVMEINLEGSATLAQTLAWLIPGLLIARIGAEMLVSRTVRVFSGKRLARYALCIAIASGAMTLMSLDVFGIAGRVPDPGEVASVSCSLWNEEMGYWWEDVPVSDESSIGAVTSLHREIVDNKDRLKSDAFVDDWIHIHYTMKDGSVLTRSYLVRYSGESDPVQQAAQTVMRLPQAHLRYLLNQEVTLEALQEKVTSLEFSGKTVTGPELDALLEALWQDLQEGHIYYGTTPEGYGQSLTLSAEIPQKNGYIREIRSCTLNLTQTAEHLWPLLESLRAGTNQG